MNLRKIKKSINAKSLFSFGTFCFIATFIVALFLLQPFNNKVLAAKDINIGTTTDSIKIGGSLCLGGSCRSSWLWTTSGTSAYYNIGNVGIGAASPATRLHVSGSSAGDGTWIDGITVENTNVTAGEAAINYKNISTGSNRWLTGLNQGAFFDLAYGTSFTDAGNKFRVSPEGNVGIGSLSPGSKLTIGTLTTGYAIDAGNQRIGNVANPNPASPQEVVTVNYFNSNIPTSVSSGAWLLGGNSPTAKGMLGNITNQDLGIKTNNLERVTILKDGNVGIGTSNPGQKLEVNGSITAGGRSRVEIDRSIGSNIGDTVAIGSFSNDAVGRNIKVYLKSHKGGTIDVLTFNINDHAYSGDTTDWLEIPLLDGVSYTDSKRFTVDVYRQNVNATSDPLYVRVRSLYPSNGSVQIVLEYDDDVVFTPLNSQSNVSTLFNVASAPAGGPVSGIKGNVEWNFPVSNGRGWRAGVYGLFIKNNGNIGIGTTSPTSKLVIDNVTTGYAIDAGNQRIGNVANPNPTSPQEVVTVNYFNSNIPTSVSSGAWLLGGNSPTAKGVLGNITNQDLGIKTNNLERVTILKDGNVGIGTDSPGSKLDVRGDVAFGDNINLGNSSSVSTTAYRGITWHNEASKTDYAIFKPAGAWTQPLHIAFTTGIKIGASPSYGGTKFFSQSGMTTELMSIGSVDSHVRIANNLYIGGSISANAKNNSLGTSTNWDEVGLNKQTALRFQGHDQFWIGAGNGSWYTGSASSNHHDLLITTMNSPSPYTRGITFAAATNGSYNSGYRLGKWYSETSSITSHLDIDGNFRVAGNVGVGTISPTSKLAIDNVTSGYAIDAGNQRIGNVANPNPTSPQEVVTVNYFNSNIPTSVSSGAWLLGGNSPAAKGVLGNITNQDLGIKTNNLERVTILRDGNVGIGTTNPLGKLNVDTGDILFTSGLSYGTWRNSAKISSMSHLKGRQVNNNPDFLEGLSGYTVYDNNGSGAVTLSLINDDTAPNSAGRVMELNHSTIASPSPGLGGFYKAISRCNGVSVGHCYREGNRLVYRLWAKLPITYKINFTTNAYGSGGSVVWISSNDGTGSWEEYVVIQTIGSGGSFSSTGFFFLTGGSAPLTWHIASLDIIDIDQISDADRASKLNIGYKRDVNLGTGSLLSTNSSYLAVDSGNVGIGTISPTSKLAIGSVTSGYAIDAGNKGIGNVSNPNPANPQEVVTVDYFNSNVPTAVSTGAWILGGNSPTAKGVLGNITNQDLGIKTNNLERVTILKGGNVGIGTMAPNAKLAVAGTGTESNVSVEVTAFYNPRFKLTETAPGGNTWQLMSGITTRNDFGIFQESAANTRFYIKSDGNVGIGSTNPGTKLSFGNPGANTKVLSIYEDSSGAAGIGTYGVAGLNLYSYGSPYDISLGTSLATNMIVKGTGNVGIGTIDPKAKLDVVGGKVQDVTGLILRNSYWSCNQSLSLDFWNGSNKTTNAASRIVSSMDGCSGGGERLSFFTQPVGGDQLASVENMTIKASGNVGIGNTTPTSKLAIGSVTTGYAIDAGNQRIGNVANPNPTSPQEVVTVNYFNSNIPTSVSSGAWLLGGNSPTAKGMLGNITNQDLGIKTNNVERLTVSKDGNVGVGTTVPWATLTAKGLASEPSLVSGTAALFSVSTAGGTDLVFTNSGAAPWTTSIQNRNVPAGVNGAYPIAINPLGGNVGIGTVTPGHKLTVTGGSLALESGNFYMASEKLLSFNYGVDNNYIINKVGSTLHFNTGGTFDFMGGNVGIGTTAPGSKLTIGPLTTGYAIDAGNQRIGNVANPNPTSPQEVVTVDYFNSNIPTSVSSGAWLLGGNSPTAKGVLGNITNQDLGIKTNNLERVTILKDGNVGIGTNSPGANLEVRGATNGVLRISTGRDSAADIAELDFWWSGNPHARITANAAGNTSNLRFWVRDGAATAVEKMSILSSGNVGIGITNPGAKLEVVGNVKATEFTDGYITWNAAQLNRVNGNIEMQWSGSGANGIRFFGNTTYPIIFNGSGNVGIGTNAPSTKLSFGNPGSNKDVLSIYQDSSGTAGIGTYGVAGLKLYSYNSGYDVLIGARTGLDAISPNMIIKGSGNVGIGNTAPGSKLAIGSVASGYAIDAGNKGIGNVSNPNPANPQEVVTVNYLNTSIDAKISSAKSDNYGYKYVYNVTIYGDHDKYYPFVIYGGDQTVKRDILIKRAYSEAHPPEWNSATHGGGLTLKIRTNFGSWGGANYSWEIHELEEMYNSTFGGAETVTSYMGFAVFLRGGGTGGAPYHIYSDMPIEGSHPIHLDGVGTSGTSPQVYYNGETVRYSDSTYTWAIPQPRTTPNTEEIRVRKFIALAQLMNSNIKGLTGNYIPKRSGDHYFANSLLYDNGTNIGIGTTVVPQKLNVAGGAQFGAVSFGVSPGSSQPTGLATAAYVDAKAGGADGLKFSRTVAPNANYAALATDYLIAFPTLTANRTLTLPACSNGKAVMVANETTTAFSVIVTPQSGTISGSASFSLPQSSVIPIYCNGTNWFIY